MAWTMTRDLLHLNNRMTNCLNNSSHNSITKSTYKRASIAKKIEIELNAILNFKSIIKAISFIPE